MNWILAQATTAPAHALNGDAGNFWMPPQASTVAGDVDGMFNFILWITVFFFILNTLLLAFFVIRYRHRPGREKADPAPAHSTALELTWTIIPTVIVLVIFYFGFRGFLHMSVAPPNAYEIQVTGKMWSWSFTYPNGYVASELHVPVNVPILLVLNSEDVIHGLYIPAFRIKKDVVPGRYNRFWFQATQVSSTDGYDIYCTQYCGQGHSQMRSKAFVHDLIGFKAWLEENSNWEKRMTPLEAGRMLVNATGCLQCHSVDGTAKNGPTFKDLFGRDEPMNDGSAIHVDENYIAESILAPAAKVVRGYTVQMSSYRAQLKDRDINAIIQYLKSISVNYKPAPLPTTAPAQPAPAAQ
jgi:cytochrome c oxidase subunit II